MSPKSELDRLFAEVFPTIPAPDRLMCEYCGDSGDVHTIDGEWRGRCDQCGAFDFLYPPSTAHDSPATDSEGEKE